MTMKKEDEIDNILQRKLFLWPKHTNRDPAAEQKRQQQQQQQQQTPTSVKISETLRKYLIGRLIQPTDGHLHFAAKNLE